MEFISQLALKKYPFYCVNTSYPMDNCFTGRRDWSCQTPEKDVLYIIPAGPVRRAHSPGVASYILFLSRQRDIIASFSFGARRYQTRFLQRRTFISTKNLTAVFYPTALKGCRGIVFTHGVRMGGWAGGGKKFVRPVSQKL